MNARTKAIEIAAQRVIEAWDDCHDGATDDDAMAIHALRSALTAPQDEPHVWTHPAEDCDKEGCTHRTVRTCEQSEKEKQFLRDRLDHMRERLYKIAPDEARKDWDRIVMAADLASNIRCADCGGDERHPNHYRPSGAAHPFRPR